MRGFTIIFLFSGFVCFGQADHSLFYQDQFKGGVCFSGFGIGHSGTTYATSELTIEPGSSIRKAYLFYMVQTHPTGINDLILPFNIEINGFSFKLDTLNPLFRNERYDTGNDEWANYFLHAIDITNIIQATDTEITYEVASQPAANNRFMFFCTYVLYENPTLPVINPSIYLNQEKMWVPMVYQLNQHNKIDLSQPVSLSTVINSSTCQQDGFNIFVNSDSVGLIGGHDNNSYGPPGAMNSGQFYHQNNTIYGLDDDTPDMIMDSSDALANIQLYITDPNEFQLMFDYSGGYWPTYSYTYEDFPDGLSNQICMMLINYAPACDATLLDVAFTDTTICYGDSLTLQAFGGASYKWEPALYLDCDTCATPVCKPEESTWYSCTITTADTCSKTIPVFVKVNQSAKITATSVFSDTCGTDVGYFGVACSGIEPFTYALGTISQSTGGFFNQKFGTHELTITDGNGCNFDTSIFIPTVNLVRAGFKADPTYGELPLTVNFTDQSSNANNWIWTINGDSLFEQNPKYLFEVNDTFLITQIVYNNYSECADTAFASIKVFKPVTIQIPNVFTPNGDQINDDFLINVEGAEIIRWEFVNRWGQTVVLGEQKIGVQEQELNLWDGLSLNYRLPVTAGVYFYRIVVKTPAFVTRIYTGSVTVLR